MRAAALALPLLALLLRCPSSAAPPAPDVRPDPTPTAPAVTPLPAPDATPPVAPTPDVPTPDVPTPDVPTPEVPRPDATPSPAPTPDVPAADVPPSDVPGDVPAARADGAAMMATEAPESRTFGGLPEAQILEAIRTQPVQSRRPVGSTSVNLHLDLAGDIDAGWKPHATTHRERYRAEIAAFRLNRLLGLSRVPPAVSRSLPRSTLRLAPDSPVVFEPNGTARGAAMYWVPVLRGSGVDGPAQIERWTRSLQVSTTLPTDPVQLARLEQISTLLVFDLLTGNWDRWSGANIPADAQGELLYRDNNGAFDEPFVDAQLRQSLYWLRRTQRFRRSVIDRARFLTDAAIRAEMALDPDPRHPPLSDAQIRSLLRRRDALIGYVDGLVTRHGAARVYAW